VDYYITKRLAEAEFGDQVNPAQPVVFTDSKSYLDDLLNQELKTQAFGKYIPKDSLPDDIPATLPENPRNLAEKVGEANAAWIKGYSNSAFYRDFGIVPENEGQHKLLWRYEVADEGEREFMRHQWAQWAATERMDQLADAG